MNDATLERLMMDAAVGGLNKDVRELLMAHLERDEQKLREVAELQELVRGARQAMTEECPADFGELSRVEPDLQAARKLWKIDRAVAWSARIVAMAACLVIGFGIARMRPAKQVDVVVREKPVSPPVVAVNDSRPAAEGELWSARRIYKNAAEVNRTEKPKTAMKRIFQ